MKIVLLLLSSAMLAVLCYAAFRENVTEFYDYIDSIEKPLMRINFLKDLNKKHKKSIFILKIKKIKKH